LNKWMYLNTIIQKPKIINLAIFCDLICPFGGKNRFLEQITAFLRNNGFLAEDDSASRLYQIRY